MTRGSLTVGAFSLLLVTGLVTWASSVSRSTDSRTGSPAATGRKSAPPGRGASPPSSPPSNGASSASEPDRSPSSGDAGRPDAGPPAIALGEVAAGVRHRIIESTLLPMMRQPRLRAGVFGMDLGSAAFFDLCGAESFPAASLIKIPIAVALLAEVDAGTISLAEILEMRASDVAGGSGGLQYQPVGSRFSVQRLAELMIRRSDNTATNMLIARLGGMERLNELFSKWGLPRTHLETPLPDLMGTNRTSPRDLVTVLRAAVSGGLLETASRELLLSWMRRTHVRSLLPAGVGLGSRVANKTGDIPFAIGDAGYVEAPNGRRYFLAVQVERPRNSSRAKELIRSVSKTVFDSLVGRRGYASRTSYRRPRQPQRGAAAAGTGRSKAS